ncbi:hypothetical protein [Paenibacillus odorifer]|uniref:hypothetical protein n=1 Tax=Paenibacillus odorifer TaxID=189426 RepID=UPI002115CF47|nr:hypothetical protein [Paenibacillus odorifer]
MKICVVCGCRDVPTVDLDIPVKSNTDLLKSVKVTGSKCSKCGEEYISGKELQAIEQIEKALKELAVGA